MKKDNFQLTTKDYKKKVADDIFAVLKENGFKKVGMNFRKPYNDLIYFIQIQSSQSSRTTVCKLTLNIGIVSLKLCELMEIDKPNYLHSHWTKRIGFYLEQPTDKWWAIENLLSTDKASKEITNLLRSVVLHHIFSFKTTNDLADFWLNGNYQGLTKGQQEDYLKLLGY